MVQLSHYMERGNRDKGWVSVGFHRLVRVHNGKRSQNQKFNGGLELH